MKDLISLLDKTTTLTLELLDVLSEERAALSQQDITILESVIEKKLGVAQALQAIDQQRDNTLAKLGTTPGVAGIEALLATHADQQLNASWQALCEAGLRCKEENLLVGTMIRKNKLVTDQALQVLRKGNIETGQTYSANGITARQSQSSPLGKA
ncbi:MAG: flagellar protein FlgN [Gammaproteobacteria bacterium]|nr:flagellar protein FlgN [Gammaproteobacteria bacterium]